MDKHLFKSCEGIDASLFVGDILYVAEEENLEAFKECLPSDVVKGKIDKSFTHIMWFNK